MSDASFSAQLRRRALRAGLVDYLWAVLIGVALIPWGLYFLLGKCSDCTGWNIGGIAIGLAMIGGSGGIFYWMFGDIKKRRAPDGDPVSRQLAAYGDIATLAGQLDADFAGQKVRRKRFYLGKRWLVFVPGDVYVVRAQDLIWAYHESIRHRLNGIIPLWTTHQLSVWEKSGRGVAMEMKKGEVDGALQSVAEAAPWILLGYSEKYKESWNNDREDLIAFVEKRKSEKK